MAGTFPPLTRDRDAGGTTAGHAPTPQRRIRHQARDTLAVAAFSLGASVAATAVIWAVLWVLA